MKQLTAITERNEDSFFAYVKEIDGIVVGGLDFKEVKSNFEEMLVLAQEEDDQIKRLLDTGYKLKIEVDLEL